MYGEMIFGTIPLAYKVYKRLVDNSPTWPPIFVYYDRCFLNVEGRPAQYQLLNRKLWFGILFTLGLKYQSTCIAWPPIHHGHSIVHDTIIWLSSSFASYACCSCYSKRNKELFAMRCMFEWVHDCWFLHIDDAIEIFTICKFLNWYCTLVALCGSASIYWIFSSKFSAKYSATAFDYYCKSLNRIR